jgi:ribose 5-phosphate isomerase B
VEDIGTHDTSRTDYPDYAHLVANLVSETKANLGILVCGTGVGMSMAANRHPRVRAAACNDLYTAQMARKHNDANILCLGARIVGSGLATEIVKTFLVTHFEEGRHVSRVRKIEKTP